MRRHSACTAGLLLVLGVARVASAQDAAFRPPRGPWRLHEVLGVRWLRFGLEQRTRGEHLANDFRDAAAGDSTALLLRTLLFAEAGGSTFAVRAELQDSRAYATAGTPLNNTLVDPLELLQAHARLRLTGLFTAGDAASLTAGRLTLDVGSRRLVARNGFRNTINGFTGVELGWAGASGERVQVFAVLPVTRLPAEGPALGANAVVFDRENTSTLFWGARLASAPTRTGLTFEGYVLGLHEGDHPLAPSANRRLVTAGVRLLRESAIGRFDLELEAMVQLGTSRATALPTDTAELAHRAASLHLGAGRRFDAPATPRLAVTYDFASGDGDPGDDLNGRFDPLFGARTFDFGPTGLYGVVARSNLHAPALKVEVSPHETFDAIAMVQLLWLASPRDAWTTAARSDPAGASGSFVGQQLAGRVRWRPFPDNVALELGGAWVVQGSFAKTAPGARSRDPLYAYLQLTGAL